MREIDALTKVYFGDLVENIKRLVWNTGCYFTETTYQGNQVKIVGKNYNSIIKITIEDVF